MTLDCSVLPFAPPDAAFLRMLGIPRVEACGWGGQAGKVSTADDKVTQVGIAHLVFILAESDDTVTEVESPQFGSGHFQKSGYIPLG